MKKYNEIKKIENPTLGITRKFAEDGIHRETIEKHKESGEDKEKWKKLKYLKTKKLK